MRARHLSAVPLQVQAQVDWLRRYAGSQGQAYFVIADGQNGAPLGTVRLYDSSRQYRSSRSYARTGAS